jgi:hypothetical protein
MDNHFRLFVFCALIGAFFLSQCSSPAPTNQNPSEILIPTATPTQVSNLDPQTQSPSDKLSGTLEIRFPDPWERPEFCSSEIPYQMKLSDGTYRLTGEGNFYCHQIMTYEEGFKQHLEQNYAIQLTGTMPVNPDSILEMTLTMSGIQENYYSDYPEDAPEIITASNPIDIDIEQPVKLRFKYDEGAYCLWNNQGVLTSLPGDEPPVGEDGWLFILHPSQ